MRKLYTLFLVFLFIVINQVNSQTLLPDFYGTNGTVRAIAQSGSTIYIGGNFTAVGLNAPYGSSINSTTGAPDFSFAKPNSDVYVTVPDGSGGWYIGGSFTKVGTTTRNHIARINADGSLNAWDPNANNTVLAIAVNGSAIYAGGTFTTMGGQTRNYIAELDASTGSAISWDPGANNPVWTIAANGSTIYAGGSFTTIGGQTRNYIAALDATTGNATAWDPNASFYVNTIAVNGSTVYAGGSFTTIGGLTRNYIAALDATTGNATSWNPNALTTVSGTFVYTIAVNGSTIYAGGTFANIGGQSRNNIAALDATTGLATSWDANANNTVRTIAVNGSTVYAGGDFTTIGGQTRNRMAALDATSGFATSWDASANNAVRTIAANESTVYAGGSFILLGTQTRNRIAALDAATGTITSWNPNANNIVYTIAVNASAVYAGGAFTTIGGQSRNRIAALDATTGLATSWNPNVATLGSTVYTIAVNGSVIYAGGTFTTIGGQSRNRIAALDVSTGLATSWDPNASTSGSTVYTIAVNGSTIYAGGAFANIGGQSRSCIAALDATTGLATSWNANANNTVRTIAVSGSAVYAGGDFTTMGGQTRNRIAALDATSGNATSWNPNASNTVYTITVNGSAVYAGGLFNSIGGQTRNDIAALDATTGTATSWNPGPNAATYAIVVNGSVLYAVGSFFTLNGVPQPYFAAFSMSTLPLHFLSFTVNAQRDAAAKVFCNWKTANEQNTSHFIVERSADGRTFSGIGMVTANGNSSTDQQYSFTDNNPLAITAWYRIKQVDMDGAFTYSKIITVAAISDESTIRLFPNPVKQEATLMVTLLEKEYCRNTIYDQNGRLISSSFLYLDKGSNSISVPVQMLVNGIYTIKLSGTKTNKQLQFVKQ